MIDENFATAATPDRVERATAALRENGYLVHVVDSADATEESVMTLATGAAPAAA